MKKLHVILVLIWLAVAALVSAQTRGGRVAEGRLVNRTDPSIVAAHTELEVLALGSGMDIIRTAATDATGAFRIEGLPDGEPLMLRAIYKGANYHGALKFDASGLARLELEVYEPTISRQDIKAESVIMTFKLEGDHLHALETWVIANRTHPPRTYVNPEGNFRVSKAPGILAPPVIRITAPGTEMPLTQSALESADGQSYYSLYPLRPGPTTIEVSQTLPYQDHKYVYKKKFFADTPQLSIGVIPGDMTLAGPTLEKTEAHAAENFAVYAGAPAKAGAEVAWTLTGGTPVAEPESDAIIAATREIIAVDGFIGRHALFLGSTILLILVLALWWAFNRLPDGPPASRERL